MTEYIPWYHPGSQLLRCLSCASLVVEGDIELHNKWHATLESVLRRGATLTERLAGAICTDPDCTITRKPGRPMHGPHDFRARKAT
jgi:ferredoxin